MIRRDIGISFEGFLPDSQALYSPAAAAFQVLGDIKASAQ